MSRSAPAAVVMASDWASTACASCQRVERVRNLGEAREHGLTVERLFVEHLAHFKTPRTIVFGALPKTSTGKIQKFVLRERARAL